MKGIQTCDFARMISKFDRNKYEIVLDNITWDEARVKAAEKGGKLVTLDDMDEYNYVLYLIKTEGNTDAFYYLGGRRDPDSTEYHWVDKDNSLEEYTLNPESSWCKSLWEPGEPNYKWDEESDLVVIMYHNKSENRWYWYDGPIDSFASWRQYAYIIEY